MRNLVSPLSETRCVEYAWHQLMQRAAPESDDASLGVPLYYAKPGQVDFDGPGIIVVPCVSGWMRLLEQPQESLDWVPIGDVLPRNTDSSNPDPIPVLFWGEGHDGSKPFVELRDDGKLIFYADILAATFFMLSRWEETVVPARDEHDRFPGSSSVAYKQGFLGRPIVDEYALILREWLKIILPSWEPKTSSFSIELLHCIDHVRLFKDWRVAARVIAGDLFRRRSLELARRDLVGTLFPHRDPFLERIIELADFSLIIGLDDTTFHFMVEEEGEHSEGYDLTSSPLRECISTLRQRNFKLGLHAGYRTLNDPERLASEKAVFKAVFNEFPSRGSQHFLRFQIPHTWRQWEQVGLTRVSTMTYADHEGFRCGTCHPFRPYDLVQNRELNLYELPLIAMDVTLLHYRKLSPVEAEARIMELARRCKQVGGTFTLLWHNSSFDGAWEPWGHMFRRTVRSLSEIS